MEPNINQKPEGRSTSAARGRDEISALRRHQRRLLYGGGGFISLLLILAGLASAMSGVEDFHARERQVFDDGQQSINAFLERRDRSYASSIRANDSLWTQGAFLNEQGLPLVATFRAQGEQMTVIAPGDAVPWLVLGNEAATRLGDHLPRYLGMLYQYSAFTQAITSAIQQTGKPIAYGYDPSGALLAVTGIDSESTLLKMLGAKSRSEAISRLMISEQRLRSLDRSLRSGNPWLQSDRIVYFVDVSPFTGEDTLITVVSLAVEGRLYFRRVILEPMTLLKELLRESSSESFVVASRDGKILLSSGNLPEEPAIKRAALVAGAANGAVRLRKGGIYLIAGTLHGVDWIAIHSYSVQDVLRSEGSLLAVTAIVTLTILGLLWLVLLRMDRYVFAPALADASRVYESDALNRTIVETSPVGLALIEPGNDEPIMQNAAGRELVGNVPEALEALYTELADQALHANVRQIHEFQRSFERGGEPRHLQILMAPTIYSEKRAWLCVMRDITAETELQDRLRRARVDSEAAQLAAEKASQAKSTFVATMSHEIRTPLNAVLGHLELLSRSSLHPEQQERIERIRLSADSLLDIISDVLDFSRIESGQLTVEMAPFALRPMLEQAALLYAPGAQRKGVKLYYNIDRELASYYISDVLRLRQILNNLLGNAAKFTESGRILLKVWLVSRGDLDNVRFDVVDSGIGMTPTQVSRLFEPFTQADSGTSRRYGGSGLGLALCRQLSHLLGGEIQIQSTSGVGSVFSLELSLQSSGTNSQALPLSGWRLHLLSAAAEWRREISEMLLSHGAHVISAASPDQLPLDREGCVLIIAGEQRVWAINEEKEVCSSYDRVVVATSGGPLVPEERDGRILATCYLSDVIIAAILGDLPAGRPRRDRPEWEGQRASRGRVLLVEDHPVSRELIQQQLETIGFEVDVSADGLEALQVWRPAIHVAVITDINMPGMGGYALAHELRERSGDVPILAITASALPDEGRLCREAGITALLLKPLSLERLDAAMKECVRPPSRPPSLNQDVATFPEKVRRMFVQTGEADLRRLVSATMVGDNTTLRSVIHSFKGVLLMLKESESAGLCTKLEDELAEVDFEDVNGEIPSLIDMLGQVLDRYRSSLED